MSVRVLHVIKQLRVGGAERVVVQIATNMPQGLEPAVCAFRDGPFAADLRSAGIPVFTFFPPDRPFSRREACRRLKELIGEWQPQIVHTHMIEANLIGGWAARRQGVRQVAHVHGPAEWQNSWFHKMACRFGYGWLWGREATFVAVSQGLAHLLRCATGVEAQVVRNGIDVGLYRPRPASGRLLAELGLPDGSPIVGAVARFEYQKNPQCFVRAAARVCDAVPEVHFVTVGGGEAALRDEAVQLASKLRIADRYHPLGERNDVPDLLPEFDVFALPSRYEGLPLVFAEAMSCGLSVVATDVVGVNEVVAAGETGFLVPSDDHEALAERIVQLVQDEDLRNRMGATGRKRVEEHFSIPRMIEQIVAIYDETLSEGDGDPGRIDWKGRQD